MSSHQLVSSDPVFGFELLALRGPRRLLVLKLLPLGRELFVFDRQLIRGNMLLVPQVASLREFLSLSLKLLAFVDPAFAFRLPMGSLLLPFLFFFDELPPIGLQPIPRMFQRLLFASEVGLLLLELRHSPREVLELRQNFRRMLLDVLPLFGQGCDRLISLKLLSLKLLTHGFDLLTFAE